MPSISIIMPCYNAGKFLRKSVDSVIRQSFKDWELIIVNDGSTDGSRMVAEEIAGEDARVRVISKENGGYVSARIEGYRLISPESKYIIFYDADDMLHPEMLVSLAAELEKDGKIGAAYCDHLFIDEHDQVQTRGANMPRFVPTRFWTRQLPETEPRTPFVSIFCWTKMIEPMVLIRRTAYDQTRGWDMDFGKGIGNIGEGVYLFSEIALKWEVHYINKPLYYYRRYSGQMSSVSDAKMRMQADLILDKWRDRVRSGFEQSDKIRAAILFYRYRQSVYRRLHSLKHQIRYTPFTAMKSVFLIFTGYLCSLPLVFSYRSLEK
jgi:glycosyltransferase involved in cell wall biosynthesis